MLNGASDSISICIATYRRPKPLARLLDSLLRLKIPSDVVVEIIVVDNDKEESAREVVAARSLDLKPRYFVECRKNIAHARNRALAEARGRWLLFIDDDEVADENWLNAYLEMLDSVECDGLFGPVIPKLEEVVTPWLDVETFYTPARHVTGTELGITDLWTSNAILRRKLFAGREFDPAYGRSGGEDNELFGRLVATGARFLWCDDARITEFLPPAPRTASIVLAPASRLQRGMRLYTASQHVDPRRLRSEHGPCGSTPLCLHGPPAPGLAARAPTRRESIAARLHPGRPSLGTRGKNFRKLRPPRATRRRDAHRLASECSESLSHFALREHRRSKGRRLSRPLRRRFGRKRD